MLRTIITTFCLVCLSTTLAWGDAGNEADDGIRIKADAMDHNQADDVITASGNVVILWKGATLTSDRASYDRAKKVLTATSNVVIIKGGDTVKGESVSLDLDSGRGELVKGKIFTKQKNAYVTGDSIKRIGESDYTATQGSFTTCDDKSPSWKFGASDLEMTVDETASARNVVFYIKDVPVFYFPYIVFPAKTERRSGFLFPRFGYSDKDGYKADIFYYWAISPSQDATISLNLESKRAVGMGLDYRYLRSRGSSGELGGYLIYDYNTHNPRGIIAQSHREIFSPEMNLRTSINMTSDRLVFSDYGQKSGVYNLQSNDSTVNFLKTWQNLALTANARYTQDYYTQTNSGTLQTLPQIGLSGVRQQIFSSPVYFDFDSYVTNFYAESAVRGQRFYGKPRLTLVTGIPGYLNVSVTGGAHLRAYQSDNIPPNSSIHDVDGSLLPEAGVRMSTSLSKVYDVNGEKLQKLRHEIAPEITYNINGHQNQSRLPNYDYLDRIVYQNIVYYSLTNFLGGKFRNGDTSEYRDLMRLTLIQGYSFAGGRPDLLTAVDAHRPFTDLTLGSEAWFHPQTKLTFDASYNVYGNYISSAAPGVEFDDKRGTTAGISYHMEHKLVDYIEGRLSTKFIKPWTFSYSSRYSFNSHNLLSSVYSAEYRHQCWSIIVSYHDRRVTNPNQTFTVNFNLLGVFSSGSSAGGLPGTKTTEN